MSTTAGLAIHPLADLIPAMSDESFAELRADVAAHGLRQPVVLFEHMVLDGRHRLRACEETGTEPRFEEYDGDEPAAHVLSLNLHRRHLSVSQRAMIGAAFLPELEKEAKGRQGHGLTAPGRHMERSATPVTERPEPDRAAARAGQFVGVSHNSIDKAKRIGREAPDLAPLVSDGSLTVNAADAIVRQRATKAPTPENGRLASGRSIQRIADQAASLEMALGAIPLNKSCGRLSADERAEALEKCKKGRKAINALVNALLAASER